MMMMLMMIYLSAWVVFDCRAAGNQSPQLKSKAIMCTTYKGSTQNGGQLGVRSRMCDGGDGGE